MMVKGALLLIFSLIVLIRINHCQDGFATLGEGTTGIINFNLDGQ